MPALAKAAPGFEVAIDEDFSASSPRDFASGYGVTIAGRHEQQSTVRSYPSPALRQRQTSPSMRIFKGAVVAHGRRAAVFKATGIPSAFVKEA